MKYALTLAFIIALSALSGCSKTVAEAPPPKATPVKAKKPPEIPPELLQLMENLLAEGKSIRSKLVEARTETERRYNRSRKDRDEASRKVEAFLPSGDRERFKADDRYGEDMFAIGDKTIRAIENWEASLQRAIDVRDLPVMRDAGERLQEILNQMQAEIDALKAARKAGSP
jgi:hypothetical protein